MRSVLFWAVTQRVVVISYHLRGQGFWPLKMGPIGCPETSVRIYHYSLRNSPEERSSVATVGSAHPYRNGQKPKMLKYIKFITINCSIRYKIFKYVTLSHLSCQFLILLYYVENVCKRRSTLHMTCVHLVQIRMESIPMFIYIPHVI
jgi:hypothetical protein